MDIMKMLEFAVDYVCTPSQLYNGNNFSLSNMQCLMLMSVMKVPLDAIRHVQTHCLAMSAPVAKAISWQVMDMGVMVRMYG